MHLFIPFPPAPVPKSISTRWSLLESVLLLLREYGVERPELELKLPDLRRNSVYRDFRWSLIMENNMEQRIMSRLLQITHLSLL